MNEEKRPLPSPDDVELRANPVLGEPVDVWDQVNKYGTYEVQDTTDTDNVFPLIGPFGAGVNGVTLPSIPDAVKDKQRPRKEQ